jgi:hypothetical protein
MTSAQIICFRSDCLLRYHSARVRMPGFFNAASRSMSPSTGVAGNNELRLALCTVARLFLAALSI